MKIPEFQSDTRRMPVAWLSLTDQVVIIRMYNYKIFKINNHYFVLIVIIFILNTCVYKRLRNDNESFAIKWRFIIGMTTAILSMCLAGVVEIFRQQKCETYIQQTIGMCELVCCLYII